MHYETLQCAGVKFFALNIAAGRYYKLLPCRKDTKVTAAKVVLNPGVLGNKAPAFLTRDKTQQGVWWHAQELVGEISVKVLVQIPK